MSPMARPGPFDLDGGVDPGTLKWDRNGLVVGVVQDVADGRVLMVGWLDVEALAATLGTGDVHFHSRSRGRLWRKGETSGNVLKLRSLALDCDGDALLIGAEPLGPTCHRETRSCFDPDALSQAVGGFEQDAAAHHRPAPGSDPVELPDANDGWQGFAWLENLWATIRERAERRTEGSYTVQLLDGGVDATGRKVTEEATEVLLAAKNDEAAEARGADRTELRELIAGEAGDLLYHALVLLAEREVEPREVMRVLRGRHGGPRRTG